MKIYNIWLDKDYPDEVFMTDWDLDLVGDALREEFESYIEDYKKKLGVITGGTKRILVGEELKKFMVRKQVNLVESSNINATLESKFILRKGEEKKVDERAWNSLRRFEYKETKSASGEPLVVQGYIHFKVISDDKSSETPVHVTGADVEYFPEPTVEKQESAGVEKFHCEKCGKVFDKKVQLVAHTNLRHSK